MDNKKLPLIYINRKIVLPTAIEEISIPNNLMELIKLSKEKYNGKILIGYKEIKDKKLLSQAKILKEMDLNGALTIIVEGENRAIFTGEPSTSSGIVGYKIINDVASKNKDKISSYREAIQMALKQPELPFSFDIDKKEITSLKELSDSKFIDRISSIFPLPNSFRGSLLGVRSVEERYDNVLKQFTKILNSNSKNSSDQEGEVKTFIQNKVKSKIQGQQREFYLKEQLKAIQSELDELSGEEKEFDKLRKQIENNPYPEAIKTKALSELKKLELTPPQAQEANIIRTYLDWLLNVPYWQKDEGKVDIGYAKKILDDHHYGLEKPKSKIIEFLAAKQQNPDAKGSILAIVGPPGTGKTSLAKSIAESLNRKFVKISLGGVKDEAEIKGHRRTYIGAMPGKIVQAMKKAGVSNPIILLDEIDKMSSDYKGDPTSAMLEVLDYEQNNMFQDHFLEEDYDLSNVTFIATANYFSQIPRPLIDRLDIVELSSYTELEKIAIFKKHILKRVKNETKIPSDFFKWSSPAIKTLIRHYTIEAGVRQLHRETNTVARKILVKKINGELKKGKQITPELLEELLGPQKYDYTRIESEPQIGTVIGLAWTAYGGDILPIEVSLFPGKGGISITGQLKDVMTESAKIALSYIKANSEKFGIKDFSEKFEKLDIHIHSPDGSTPKDGPSAGVTFTTALISALTNKSVPQYIGMTGEITLRGKVLPIGGLKEKSISAYRSGLKTIFIPEENIKNLVDIPEEVKKKLEIIPVKDYNEIFDKLFVKSKK